MSHPLSFTLDRPQPARQPLKARFKAPTFPLLEGKTVSGEAVKIPDVAKAKTTVVGLAFSLKAENDLKTWLQPAYDQFIAKPDGVFAADAFEGLFYFVGMAGGGAAGAMSQAFEKKAKSNVDAALQPHVILYKGNADAWVKSLEIKDKNQVHIIVIAPDGRVVHILRSQNGRPLRTRRIDARCWMPDAREIENLHFANLPASSIQHLISISLDLTRNTVRQAAVRHYRQLAAS